MLKKIKIPLKHAYYPASKYEKDRLLLWLPKETLATLVKEKKAPKEIIEDYPDGLEIDVSEKSFGELKLKLDVDADSLTRAYRELRDNNLLPEDLVVDGKTLEDLIVQPPKNQLRQYRKYEPEAQETNSRSIQNKDSLGVPITKNLAGTGDRLCDPYWIAPKRGEKKKINTGRRGFKRQNPVVRVTLGSKTQKRSIGINFSVDATDLKNPMEQLEESSAVSPGILPATLKKLPGPEMSAGEDALTVLNSLKEAKGSNGESNGE